MSNSETGKADLSDRKRVGPEDESREEQFEGGLRDAEDGGAKPSGAGERAEEAHGIAQSNDLTTP